MDDRTFARFAARYDMQPDGCWRWNSRGTNGYGVISINGKQEAVHRLSYGHFHGPIPGGMVIDHTCHNADENCPGGRTCEHRRCVNPAHMRVVTHQVNLDAGRPSGWARGAEKQRSKTHCPQGHPYEGENLRIAPTGDRACRTCARVRAQERRAAKPKAAPKSRKRKFCKNGHAFAEHGTVSGGQQVCKICSRAKVQAYRARRPRTPRQPMTHCKNGHPWVDENIYVNPNGGYRACRPCHNARTLARYHAKKVAG